MFRACCTVLYSVECCTLNRCCLSVVLSKPSQGERLRDGPVQRRARASPIKPARPVRRRVQRAGGEGRRYHICRQTQLVTSGGGGGGGGGGCSSRGVGSAVRRSIRARATSCRGCCDGCTWLQGYHAIRQGSMSCDWPMTRQSHRPMTWFFIVIIIIRS